MCITEHGALVAQELIAGIAAAEVDKLAETHGMDWLDKACNRLRPLPASHVC